jgi:hypothetical protein
MMTRKHIKWPKITVMLAAVLAVQVAFAFTGSVSSSTGNSAKKEKFTLKNFNKNFKNISVVSLTNGLTLKHTQVNSQQKNNNGIQLNTVMHYEKGNTTYVYPYKHKVTAPKFKAPSPAVH